MRPGDHPVLDAVARLTMGIVGLVISIGIMYWVGKNYDPRREGDAFMVIIGVVYACMIATSSYLVLTIAVGKLTGR